jgi:hypothetical protein
VGAGLRAAQDALDGPELRALTVQRRSVVSALARQAGQAATRAGGRKESRAERTEAPSGGKAAGRAETEKVTPITQDLSRLSKAELYARATEQEVAGRSRMSRDELLHALAPTPRKRRAAV